MRVPGGAQQPAWGRGGAAAEQPPAITGVSVTNPVAISPRPNDKSDRVRRPPIRSPSRSPTIGLLRKRDVSLPCSSHEPKPPPPPSIADL